MPTFGDHRNNNKTAPISHFWFASHWESPSFIDIHAIFSAINTRDASLHGIPSLFHIPTSFMHIGPISLLTNRPCHGPWMGLIDSGTVWRYRKTIRNDSIWYLLSSGHLFARKPCWLFTSLSDMATKWLQHRPSGHFVEAWIGFNWQQLGNYISQCTATSPRAVS